MDEKKKQKKEEDIPIEHILANCEANIHCLISLLIDKGIISEKEIDNKFEELYGSQ